MEVILISGAVPANGDARLGRHDRFFAKPFAPADLADCIRAAAKASVPAGNEPGDRIRA
jgi:hypothetical protein